MQSATEFNAWMRQEMPSVRVSRYAAPGGAYTLTGVNARHLAKLLLCPWVTFVDVRSRLAHEERPLNNSDLITNTIAPLHARFPGLAGQGMTVSVKERPFDPADIDFRGRVVAAEAPAQAVSAHATAMATLIAGGGNSAPSGKGAAWQARLSSADFRELMPDDGARLTQSGVSVQNHSYGVTIENYYGLETRAYDAHATQYPQLVHVFSSGNDGDKTSPSGPYAGLAGVANLTGQFKMSKNTLSVGATDSRGNVVPLSSRGPAYDGRVKPELVAYGADGSSDAAALVSGVSLLVQQAYKEQLGGILPPAALVKAVLLNSANDTGRPAIDFESGYGQADAMGAVQTIRERRFFTSSATQNSAQVFTITVPAGSPELKITLAWHDVAAAPDVSQALVNDLDLELFRPATKQRWKPWVLSNYPHLDSLALPARRRPDHLNNVEQITIAAPAAGVYELHVRGFSVPQGPQTFSVAYEFGETVFAWLNPLVGSTFAPSAAQELRWHWAGAVTTARLEYQPVGSTAWQVINPALELKTGFTTWTTPNTATTAQLRMVTPTDLYLSEIFTIHAPLSLRVGYACPEEALLHWPAVAGATEYQLYGLSTTGLQPLQRTPDTVAVLSVTELPFRYFAVAPVLGGKMGERSPSIEYSQQGTGCYVRSFIPRQAVTDTVLLDLEIGTAYGLASIDLERQTLDGSYETIQTIGPVKDLQFAFPDPAPNSGLNNYRVRLSTTGGQIFYSEIEAVQYARTGELLAYPNPVQAGEPLQLITGTTGSVHIQLYDLLGRLVREATATGTINSLDTSGVQSGTYLVRVTPESGPRITQRIVVL
ncbi:S8 family serine peptidase [Hymenobacter sp. BT188]|uniref:S8 family serine peptidase n=1 Tax=Hymenobacter sp. BT188 TaxID=2763504 RepID=UPI0016516D30|nr:S8 family serine peptidase [Hymenobacter sp. BT188]MBC6606458.1 S8 family serine peptidase [Hymenobacter sp. BT188]